MKVMPYYFKFLGKEEVMVDRYLLTHDQNRGNLWSLPSTIVAPGQL